MLSQEDIKFYLGVFKELGFGEMSELFNASRTKKLKAGEVYIGQGELSLKLAYIRSGLIRAYYLPEQGEDITIMLRWDKQFVGSSDSVIFGRPSRFTYYALEDTVLLEIDYQRAQSIIDKSPGLSARRYDFLIQMLGQALERIETFVLLNPEERYVKLISEKPDIGKRVPDKFLATLLGVTPVSLSRIRKRIATQKKTGGN